MSNTITYQITCTPASAITQRPEDELTIEKRGDSLFINGDEYDFQQLKDGELLQREALDVDLFQSNVVRQKDTISFSIRYVYGPLASGVRQREFTRNMTANGTLKLWDEAEWPKPEVDQPDPEEQENAEGQD